MMASPNGPKQATATQIAGRELVIETHQAKIRQELAKIHPDESLISGWEREIEVRRKAIEKLVRRLKREW